MGKNPEARMSLLSHFAELRARLFKSALAVFICGTVGWFLYIRLTEILVKPVCNLSQIHSEHFANGNCGVLYINGVLGPLDLKFRVSLIFGLIFASPVWIFQLWRFLAPAMHKRERKHVLIFLASSLPFFLGGSYLGYRILPLSIRLLLGFTPENVSNLVRLDDYLTFVSQLIFVFGLAFLLPIFLLSLNTIGVLSGNSILKPWRFAIFGITLFAAIFTPTADPFTMLILALPLVLLYLSAGLVAKFRDKRKLKHL